MEVLLDTVNLSLPSNSDCSAHDLLLSLCSHELPSTEYRALYIRWFQSVMLMFIYQLSVGFSFFIFRDKAQDISHFWLLFSARYVSVVQCERA